MAVEVTIARSTIPFISFPVNAKRATDISLNRLITFGTRLALPKCVARLNKVNPKRRRYNKMKRSLRALLLLVGLVGTFAYGAIPAVPTHEGPMPLCPPSQPRCEAQ